MTDVILSQNDIFCQFSYFYAKENMKLPLRLVLFSIMLCRVIVWSSFTCFHLLHVSSKNSSSFNNYVWIRINILLMSHTDHCFVMQCFQIVLLPLPKQKYGFDMANYSPYMAHIWVRYGMVRTSYGKI